MAIFWVNIQYLLLILSIHLPHSLTFLIYHDFRLPNGGRLILTLYVNIIISISVLGRAFMARTSITDIVDGYHRPETQPHWVQRRRFSYEFYPAT